MADEQLTPPEIKAKTNHYLQIDVVFLDARLSLPALFDGTVSEHIIPLDMPRGRHAREFFFFRFFLSLPSLL